MWMMPLSFWKKAVKSVQFLAQKEVFDTLKENQTLAEIRFRAHESAIIYCSQNMFKVLLATLVALVGASAIMVNLEPFLPVSWVGSIKHWSETIGTTSAVILGGQITIIAIIYPIAITAIGSVFRGMAGENAIWQIYQRYSAVVFSGVSGLVLSALLTLFMVSKQYVSIHWQVAIFLSITFWFLLNLAMGVWFLVTTFKLLAPNFRNRLLNKFTIFEILLPSIIEGYARQISLSLDVNKLLTIPSDCPVIIQNKYMDKGKTELSHNVLLKGKKSVNDLSLIWLKLAFLIPKFTGWGIKKIDHKEDGKLALSLEISEHESRDHKLWVSNNVRVGWLSCKLIEFSVTYRPKKLQDLDRDDIHLLRLEAVRQALNSQNTSHFTSELDSLIAWYVDQLNGLHFNVTGNGVDNWLLLPIKGGTFTSRNSLNEYFSALNGLLSDVSYRVAHNPEFYVQLNYLPLNVFARYEQRVPSNIFEALLQVHRRSWEYLLEVGVDHNQEASREKDNYDIALKTFVSNWEDWTAYFRNSLKEDQAYFIEHLKQTMQLIGIAWKVNPGIASWASDMLIAWRNQNYDIFQSQDFGSTCDLINLHTVHNPQVKSYYENHGRTDQAYVEAALENYWVDARFVIAAYLIQREDWSKNENLINQVIALLKETRLHPTGAFEQTYRNLFSGDSLILAYLRIHDPCHTDNSYLGEINLLVNRLTWLNEERMVSGRIYTSSMADGFRSLNDGFIRLGLLVSEREWDLSLSTIKLLQSELFDKQYLDRFNDQLDKWVIGAEETDHPHAKTFSASIRKIKDTLSSHTGEQVTEAPLDYARIEKYEAIITEALKEPMFPVSLFKNGIQDLNGGIEMPFRLNHTNFLKERIAKGINVQRAINEDSIFATKGKQVLANLVYRSILSKPEYTELDFQHVNELLLELKRVIKTIQFKKLQPVVLISAFNVADNLRRQSRGIQTEIPFKIDLVDGSDNNYLFKADGAKIYQARGIQSDFCLVLAEEDFESIMLKRNIRNRWSDITYNPTTELDGELHIDFTYRIEFGNRDSYKLNLINN